MEYKIIETEEAYQKAINEMDVILDSGKCDEATMNHLNIMSLLIEQYEDKHCHIPLPEPIAAIKYRMEELGLKNSDMVPYFGQASRVSEVLGYKRKLSLSMMRKLSKGLGISMDILTQEYSLKESSATGESASNTKRVKTGTSLKGRVTSKTK